MVRRIRQANPYRIRMVRSGTKNRKEKVRISTCTNPNMVAAQIDFRELNSTTPHPG
jgi:hypothetical protein